jgi:CRP-like cAMP-binding protein
MILAAGTAKVVSRNRLIAILRSGALIGEISFVTKQAATATVIAQEVSRIFSVDTTKLEHLFTKYPEMERAVHRVVELDLTSKLTNSEMPAPA